MQMAHCLWRLFFPFCCPSNALCAALNQGYTWLWLLLILNNTYKSRQVLSQSERLLPVGHLCCHPWTLPVLGADSLPWSPQQMGISSRRHRLCMLLCGFSTWKDTAEPSRCKAAVPGLMNVLAFCNSMSSDSGLHFAACQES